MYVSPTVQIVWRFLTLFYVLAQANAALTVHFDPAVPAEIITLIENANDPAHVHSETVPPAEAANHASFQEQMQLSEPPEQVAMASPLLPTEPSSSQGIQVFQFLPPDLAPPPSGYQPMFENIVEQKEESVPPVLSQQDHGELLTPQSLQSEASQVEAPSFQYPHFVEIKPEGSHIDGQRSFGVKFEEAPFQQHPPEEQLPPPTESSQMDVDEAPAGANDTAEVIEELNQSSSSLSSISEAERQPPSDAESSELSELSDLDDDDGPAPSEAGGMSLSSSGGGDWHEEGGRKLRSSVKVGERERLRTPDGDEVLESGTLGKSRQYGDPRTP